MKKYQCHKQVWADKIRRIELDPAGSGDCFVYLENSSGDYCERAMLTRFTPEPGDYLVVYEDGYRSFSPAAAFEAGYTEVPA